MSSITFNNSYFNLVEREKIQGSSIVSLLKYSKRINSVFKFWKLAESLTHLLEFGGPGLYNNTTFNQIWAYFRINTIRSYKNVFKRICKYEYEGVLLIFF